MTARSAATEMVPIFYKGEWQYFTHFVYYDLEGKPSAYAFVFSRKDTILKSLSELKNSILIARNTISSVTNLIEKTYKRRDISGRDKSRAISTLQEQIRNIRMDSGGQKNYVTMITGSRDISPVILKCQKGLPEVFVEEADAYEAIKKKLSIENLRIGRIFHLGPFDIAYEVLIKKDPNDEYILINESEEDVDDNVLMFNLRTNTLVSVGELKIIAERRKAQFKAELEKDRINFNKKLWEKYKKNTSTKRIQNFIETSDENPQIITSKPQNMIIQDEMSKSSSTIFSEYFSGSHPGSWSIGHDGGGGSYAWAWPNGYAHEYSNPSGGLYYYPDNLHVYMERRNVSLSGYVQTTLSFNYIVDTEANYDFFTVNVRDQNGSWHEMFRKSGPTDPLTWTSKEIDLSSFDGQTGLYIQFRFDSDSSISGAPYAGVYVDNVVLSAEEGKPDLVPYKPSGWSDKITISKVSGTNVDGTINVNQNAYIDYSVYNSGNADATGGFWVELWDDTTGERIRRGYKSNTIPANHLYKQEDSVWTFTSAGWHQIRIKVDADNNISNESNENNNEYTRWVNVNNWVISENEIPGASDNPSSVPTYRNDETMYPIPGYSPGGGICLGNSNG